MFGRDKFWWTLVPAVVVLVVWPLQTLVAGMLVATVLVAAGIYTLWLVRHPVPADRRARLDEVARKVLLGTVITGLALVLVFPVPMAVATLGLALVSSFAWLGLDHQIRHDAAAAAAGDGTMAMAADGTGPVEQLDPDPVDAPGFWAAPEPGPAHVEPVAASTAAATRAVRVPAATRRPSPIARKGARRARRRARV